MTAEEYQEYLNSAHWKEASAQCREEYDNRCAICGSTESLNVHHWTYERLGDEDPKDLICLCQICHKRLHHVIDMMKTDLLGLYYEKHKEIYEAEQEIVAKAGYRLLGNIPTKHLPLIMGRLNSVRWELSNKSRHRAFDGVDEVTKILARLRRGK